MAKNILLKDQEAPKKGKATQSKRKKSAPKETSRFNFAFVTQAQETWADERTRSVAGLFALGLSLIFTLSVISSLFTGAVDIRIIQNAGLTDELEAYHNILGSLGAHVGYFLARQGLGIGALGVPLLSRPAWPPVVDGPRLFALGQDLPTDGLPRHVHPLGVGVLDPHHGGPHPARHQRTE